MTNAQGQVIERNDYEPYGAVIGKSAYNGIGYTGHVMDAATGLTYMQQRYYDPAVGRFLSVDPVTANAAMGANFNRYRYADNSPYRFTDPDGRQSAERFVEQHRSDMQAGRGDLYKPFQPVAVAVTGAAAAPVAWEIGAWWIANPATANSAAIGAAEMAGGDALGGAAVAAGTAAAVERLAPKMYGPFYRVESPTQTAKVAEKIQQSGALMGTGMRQVGGGRSPVPVAQAYTGSLPDGVKGIEFYSPVAPSSRSRPGAANWYRGTLGVQDIDHDWVSIPVQVTKNTQR